jgi:hypothetical protein
MKKEKKAESHQAFMAMPQSKTLLLSIAILANPLSKIIFPVT